MRRTIAWGLLGVILIAALAAPIQGLATGVSAAPLVSQSASADGMMRIWLSSMKSNTSFSLTMTGNYTINGTQLTSGSRVQVEFSGGTVYATYGGQRVSMGAGFTLTRQSGGVWIDQSSSPRNEYPGNIAFVYSGGTAYVICTLYLEDYLYGVLPYEMDNAFPLEALKAQAVTARTYAVANKKAGGLYDLSDVQSSMVFRGVDRSKTNCISAVNETKGIVMQYNGQYISANFGASNGGWTELNSNAWGGAKTAYYDIKKDPFDLANPLSPVKSYDIYKQPGSAKDDKAYALIRSALAAKRGGTAGSYYIEQITGVTLHTPRYASPSELYTQMRVNVQANGFIDTVDIPLFPTVKTGLGLSLNGSSMDNELFSVTEQTDRYVLSARRYGHGVGLSQRGAQQMANTGYNYREILGFYFTGIQLAAKSFAQNWSAGVVTGGQTGTATQAPVIVTPTPYATAAERTGRVQLANTSSRLNMRQSPNVTSQVVSRLSHGTTVTITGEVDTWYSVRYGSLSGYIAKEYVVVTQTGTPTETGGVYILTQSESLSLRSEPRATAAIVGAVPNGAAVTVLQQGTSWSQVRYGTITGYVMTQYLSTAKPGASTGTEAGLVAVVTLENPSGSLNMRVSPSTTGTVVKKLRHNDTLTVVERGDAWSKVSHGGSTGYVINTYIRFLTQVGTTAAPGAIVTPTPTHYPGVTAAPTPVASTRLAVVTLSSGSLNLRSLPNSSADIVASIPNRAQVTVTQLGDSWCGITYGQTSGYVARRYLAIETSSSGAGTGAAATVSPTQASSYAWAITEANGKVNIRRSPSITGTIIGSVPHGGQVQIIDEDKEWTYARYGSVSGYISTTYLSRTNPNVSSGGTSTKAPSGSEGYAYISTQSGGPVNLRKSASKSSTVLIEVDHGSKVQVVESGGEWTKVIAGALTGYVASQYVVANPPTTAALTTQSPSQTIRVINRARVNLDINVSLLPLRASASANAQIVANLTNNATVDVLAYHGSRAEWLYVRDGTTYGYAPRADFVLSDDVVMVSQQYDDVILYKYKDTTATVLRTLRAGELITLIYTEPDGWLNVRTSDGTVGYIKNGLVAPI